MVACGSNPEEPGFASIEAVVSVRSLAALGQQSGTCQGILFYGYEFDGFDMPLDGLVTTAVFDGFTPGSPTLETAIYEESTSEGPLAEGWGGLTLSGGDTTLVGLRARFSRSTSTYDIEMEPGGIETPDPPDSILFLGNSYTFANGGLDSIYAAFCESADPGAAPGTEMYAVGGYTLQDLYSDPQCLALIRNGGWDIVVLQEQSTLPVENPELMWEYASLLADEIEEAGSRPGFFMTWAREYDPSMTEPLAEAYSHAGALVDGMVSPVGLAWAAVRSAMPELDLYEEDGSHPNLAGTYLVVCTMYAAMTGRSPEGVGYCCDPALPAAGRLCIQQAAFEATAGYGTIDWRHY